MPRKHDSIPANPDVQAPGRTPRDTPHSSGDRNTKASERDWPRYAGGRQRDPEPAAPSRKPQR